MATIKAVVKQFDPFKNVKVPEGRKRKRALNLIKEFVLESALDKIGSGKSPVKGGPWKRKLTKGYKAIKSDVSGVTFANLELEGDLLDALDVKEKGDKLEYGVRGSEAGKADGNNRGTYGKKASSPGKARRFVPLKNETFDDTIWKGIDKIARRVRDGD